MQEAWDIVILEVRSHMPNSNMKSLPETGCATEFCGIDLGFEKKGDHQDGPGGFKVFEFGKFPGGRMKFAVKTIGDKEVYAINFQSAFCVDEARYFAEILAARAKHVYKGKCAIMADGVANHEVLFALTTASRAFYITLGDLPYLRPRLGNTERQHLGIDPVRD